MQRHSNRREFLKASAAVGVGSLVDTGAAGSGKGTSLVSGSVAICANISDVLALRLTWERRIECRIHRETFRWNPAGSQARPEESGQQPEASLAWCRGDPACEA